MLIPNTCSDSWDSCRYKTEDNFILDHGITSYLEELKTYVPDKSNKNDENKTTSKSIDPVVNQLKRQNEILKQQLEYQKKRDEKEDFRRNMDNFGNLIDSLTGSGKYYQPSTTQYCRNYGTAQHPNVICQ